MRQALSISALARSTGVTSKTLRHWERVGLLPKAARTHTGYRIFAPEVMRYIDFILKAKTVGLTLSGVKCSKVEEAPFQWRQPRSLSAKAPNRPSFEMNCPSNEGAI
jgi:hypothetical protein